MADERLAEILTRTAAELLEQVAFIFVEAGDEEPRWPAEVVEARIDIDGSRSAGLSMTVSRRQATAIAAELMGLEPDDEEAARRAVDALGEVLNMLAGLVAHKALGDEPPPVIGIPTVRLVPAAGPRGSRPDGETAVWMSTEDGEPIEVAMRLWGR
jgi:CheY-specific phosphatase CheX